MPAPVCVVTHNIHSHITTSAVNVNSYRKLSFSLQRTYKTNERMKKYQQSLGFIHFSCLSSGLLWPLITIHLWIWCIICNYACITCIGVMPRWASSSSHNLRWSYGVDAKNVSDRMHGPIRWHTRLQRFATSKSPTRLHTKDEAIESPNMSSSHILLRIFFIVHLAQTSNRNLSICSEHLFDDNNTSAMRLSLSRSCA